MGDPILIHWKGHTQRVLAVVALALVTTGCGGKSEEEHVSDLILEKGARKPAVIAYAKEKGVEGLAPHVKSENARVRMVVISALGTFKNDEKATEILLDVLKNSQDTNDIYYAIIALAEQGAPQAKEIIEKHFKGDSPRLREAAVLGIGLLGDKSLYPLVIQAMQNPDLKVQHIAGYVNDMYDIEKKLQR
jgi:HEAT repeat protein